MDGRDAMSMSGSLYYGIQQQQLNSMTGRLHNPAVPPSGIGGSGAFQMDAPPAVSSHAFQMDAPPAVSSHAGGSGGGMGGGGMSQGEPVKRKRGRPRKYGLDGNVALALSPISSSAPATAPGGSASGSGTPGQKRGRGRPPGTGRKQQLASLGAWVAGSAGMGFTPHIITVAVGEDITTKIMSFSQQGPRTICILSANGVVNTVTLRKPETSGGTVTYKGPFEILCLSGSYVLADNDGSRSRKGGLSISLSSSDGRVIGGGVGGLIEAASPVQVILGSFMHGGSKARSKKKISHESGGESDLQFVDKQNAPMTTTTTPSGAFSNQSVITPSPVMGGWPGSRQQLDMRNAHLDIDLTRG